MPKHIIPLLILFLICSCTKKEDKIIVGISQCMMDDAWRQTMIREAEIEASNYDNLELVIRNADTNNELQIKQIRELIDLGVDVLIISPNESAPLTPIAEEAYKAGIPTIITDRKINSKLYTTFIGASNYDIGHAAGQHAAGLLPPNATILEIWGLDSSSPAQERHDGFASAFADREDVTFIKLDGEWRYDTTAVRITRIELPDHIDLVYAHNDAMAIATQEYLMKKDSIKGKDIYYMGVDAVPGAGLEAIADGRINVSFLYPTGGEQVIQAAMKVANGEPTDKNIQLHSIIVDPSIARSLLIQSEQLLNYRRRIETQISRLDELFNRYRFLQNSLGIISALMIAFVALFVYIFHINKKIKRANQALHEINKKEEEQREKLIELNNEIKEVTAQKLQFFTNISHEIRTPLALVIAPLGRLINLMQDSPYLPDLKIMQKNSDRLLRIINQILDFRKIENKKEKLKIKEVDVVSFTHEVMAYFESMAQTRKINYTFHSDQKECCIWIDTDMMEKVLVNILSNAFKFVSDKGNINLFVLEEDNEVCIRIEDDGSGIKAENLPYLFDRFYTEERSVGTGIGLHLVAEYIKMHQGDIKVDSIPGERTIFSVYLKKGKEHFTEEVISEQTIPLALEASQLDNSDIEDIVSKTYPYTVLIVEDDEEVRSYLQKELSENFKILTAINGKQALQVLDKEEVSLILSDVMMPEMNGFELCRTVKTNLSFSHIPIILLTALTDERQRIFGVSRGADGYIQKPFQVNYIIVKIVHLLEERKKIRELLLHKLQENHLLIAEPEKAENIDDQFLRRFLSKIEEVYEDSEYNIEKLSESLGLSRGHLHRKIKELTGTTPVDFLRNFRISKAAQLLRQQQLTISEIAYQTGFTSPAYFSKCFKAVHNITPKEFQERG